MREDRSEADDLAQIDRSAAARANAYYVLARAFGRPDDWPDAFEDLLHKTFAATDGDASALIGQMLDSAEDKRALSVDHARLFLGPFEIQAAPWASSYLDPEQRLMGPHSRYAAEAYAEAGLAPGGGPTDAPDHVTHELEFMYFLAFQEATEDDRLWRERQERFWRQHLGHWLPSLAAAVGEAGSHSPFYAGLAGLTQAFCDREARHLGHSAAGSAPLS